VQTTCAWQQCSPDTVKDFSAVCYLTARELLTIRNWKATEIHGHIGLIQAAVDETTVEEWMPEAAFDDCSPHTAIPVKQRSSQRFNAMIAPLVGFSIKSALFYQGESDAGPQASVTTLCNASAQGNCDYTDLYTCRFGAMINGWRDLWGFGDFAFVYTQLAPVPGPEMGVNTFNTSHPGPSGGNWPELRLQQAAVLPAPGLPVDTTGMAVITDLGDTNAPPHPMNKTEVARRLALQLLHVAYAMQSLNTSTMDPYDGFADGPTIRSASVNGSTLNLEFIYAEGMAFKPTFDCGVGAYAKAGCCEFDRTFEMSTVMESDWRDDSAWDPIPVGSAEIVRSGTGTAKLTLSIPAGQAPQRIRHVHQMYPQCVLQNTRQLVSGPFIINVTQAEHVVAATTQSASPHTLKGPPVGVALTPPMGFNSWNFYHCNIDERAIRQIALTLKASGLAAKGYTYVNIDDCWQVARDPVTGVIVPDPARFPSGLKAIADWLHERCAPHHHGVWYIVVALSRVVNCTCTLCASRATHMCVAFPTLAMCLVSPTINTVLYPHSAVHVPPL
jgi:hypothetical protein